MKVNDIIIAINRCYMDDSIDEPTLTIHKEYVVTKVSKTSFWIIDDAKDSHEFLIAEFDEFFKTYDDLITILKKQIWNNILSQNIQPGIVIEMQERTINDNGDNYEFCFKNNELYDNISNKIINYSDLCIEDLSYLLEKINELLNN